MSTGAIARVGIRATTGIVARMNPVVCMSGCARNEVRTLSSSWLWCRAWKRHRGSNR